MNRNLFKNANLKEIGQLRRYMSIIYDNADFYSKHFVNKTIIYTTKNKKIELTARRDNFSKSLSVALTRELAIT